LFNFISCNLYKDQIDLTYFDCEQRSSYLRIQPYTSIDNEKGKSQYSYFAIFHEQLMLNY